MMFYCCQRKQNKLESLQRNATEDKQEGDNIFLDRLKEMQQSSFDSQENKMVSEVSIASVCLYFQDV